MTYAFEKSVPVSGGASFEAICGAYSRREKNASTESGMVNVEVLTDMTVAYV